jgi:shikimate dehydrogenase
VILGAGGAAAGAALKAALEGARRISLLARRPEKAREIKNGAARAPGVEIEIFEMTEDTLKKTLADADLLINATPLGMEGVKADFPSFGFLKALPARAPVCDLIYNPPRTRLLQEAAALGHEVINGLDMLIYQALLSDELFLGRPLDKTAMFAYIKMNVTGD